MNDLVQGWIQQLPSNEMLNLFPKPASGPYMHQKHLKCYVNSNKHSPVKKRVQHTSARVSSF